MSRDAADSDAELVARTLRGEDHAFTLLMRRHKEGVHRFVRRYFRDADAGLDLTQETFVAAWRALSRFDGRRPFPVWLRAIALNKCRDRARRELVRRVAFGDKDAASPEAQGQADPSPDGEATLIQAQRKAQLAAAIAELPSKLREPLLLTYFGDLSQQQAADVLGVSVKAVETRVYRARLRLGERLGAREE